MAFVVIAEFAVEAEDKAAFLELCKMDSERSVADEPGCEQFDAVVDGGSVVLYEVYRSKEAFETHMTMPHYTAFADGWAKLGVTKTQVRFFERVAP